MNKHFKLGKKEKRVDPRTFKLSRYLVSSNLPTPPIAIDWSGAVPTWPMFANDSVGDCTCASAGHMIEAWTGNAGQEAAVVDADVLAAYAAVGGYNPSDPSTDNGCALLDVLNYWRGTGIAGRKILAFMEVNTTNAIEVQTALWLFGGLYAGVVTPNYVQDLEPGVIWDVVPNDGGQWGGHAVPIVQSDAAQQKKCITWGAVQPMSNAFFLKYFDECYAVLSQDWINKAGLSPSGFNMAQLQSDLAALH